MTDLSRREALTAAALATLATAVPASAAWAQDAGKVGGALWDLTEIYPDEASWDAARKGALAALPGIAKYKGRLGESAEVLAEALVLQSDLSKTISRIYVYVSLKGDEDVRVSAWQERQAQAIDLYTAFGEATAWFSPELLTLGKA
ncbi:MAG: oligoendopeptidase F, partial [Sphingomonas sp.]